MLWRANHLLTFSGWMRRRLWKKETIMDTNQLIERSFPNFNPYSIVKYPDTRLVAITRSQPTKINHQGSTPRQHTLLFWPPSVTVTSAGLDLWLKSERMPLFLLLCLFLLFNEMVLIWNFKGKSTTANSV